MTLAAGYGSGGWGQSPATSAATRGSSLTTGGRCWQGHWAIPSPPSGWRCRRWAPSSTPPSPAPSVDDRRRPPPLGLAGRWPVGRPSSSADGWADAAWAWIAAFTVGDMGLRHPLQPRAGWTTSLTALLGPFAFLSLWKALATGGGAHPAWGWSALAAGIGLVRLTGVPAGSRRWSPPTLPGGPGVRAELPSAAARQGCGLLGRRAGVDGTTGSRFLPSGYIGPTPERFRPSRSGRVNLFHPTGWDPEQDQRRLTRGPGSHRPGWFPFKTGFFGKGALGGPLPPFEGPGHKPFLGYSAPDCGPGWSNLNGGGLGPPRGAWPRASGGVVIWPHRGALKAGGGCFYRPSGGHPHPPPHRGGLPIPGGQQLRGGGFEKISRGKKRAL